MAPAKDFFSELLGTIEVEQERTAILEQLTKDPKGKQMVERINRFATDGENYQQWYAKDWPTYKDAKDRLAAVEKELADAKEALKAGKPAVQTPPAETPQEFDMENMTREQLNTMLDERIKSMGFVTRGDAEAMAETKAREAAAGVTTRVYGHALPLVEQKLQLRRQFEQDFPGKKFDNEAFDKFMGENPTAFKTIGDAFGAFTKPDYDAKTKAEAFEQGRVAGAKEREDALRKEQNDLATRGLPVDMGGGSGLPAMGGGAPAEPVALDKIDAEYPMGQRGGLRLSKAIADKVKSDRAAGRVLTA